MSNRHVPVLLAETLEVLDLHRGMNVIDCTLGDAGHSEAMLEKISPDGQLLGIDADVEAILRAKNFLYKYDGQTTFVRDNFSNISEIVGNKFPYPIHAILIDLGWSTPQFQNRGRGFSFMHPDEVLDMRYGSGSYSTAKDLLRELSRDQLEEIFYEYGEEKLSAEIADAIVAEREGRPIEIVGTLVDIILGVYRKKLKTEKEVPWVGGLHPATKVFQALRIAVNDELGVISQTVPAAIDLLEVGGRLAIITFHSLEDRLVKHYFKKAGMQKKVEVLTNKPIICSAQEYKNNPPSRSAKLRVVEKL